MSQSRKSAGSKPVEPELISPGEAVSKTVVGETQALIPRGAGATLLVCIGPMTGQRHIINDRLVLGRSDACDVVLADDRVSGRHCEVVPGPSGHRVRDLGSSNGTLVNAQKISEADLRDGDLLQVGFTVFKYLGNGVQQNGVSAMRHMQAPTPEFGRVERVTSPQGYPQAQAQPQAPQVVVQTGAAPEKEMNIEEMVGSARRVVDFFWPYRKLIAKAALAGLLVGPISYAVKPPAATATFEMTISSTFDKSTGNVLADRGHSAEPAFTSDAVITRTLAKLGEKSPDPDRIAVLQRLLQFRSLTPSYMMLPVMKFSGDFMAKDDETALKFLQTHVTEFIASEVEKTTQIMRGKIDFLQAEIEKSEATLRAADESLRSFRKEKLASLPENMAKSQEQLFDLERDVAELTADLDRLRLELQSATSGGGSGRKQRAIQALREQMAELKSGGLGENHPDVVALREKITRAEAAPDDAPSGRSGDKSVAQLRAEQSSKTNLVTQKKKQLEALQAAVASTPDFEAKYTELNRKYAEAKKNHDKFADDFSQAQYQLGLEKTAAESRFEVTRPPRVESQSLVKGLGKRLVITTVALVGLAMAYAAYRRLRKVWQRT
jgi:pSer/pThr/pTyr-binding forkhead associated (FHA) protein